MIAFIHLSGVFFLYRYTTAQCRSEYWTDLHKVLFLPRSLRPGQATIIVSIIVSHEVAILSYFNRE
jgi:hypothetical protein